MRDEQRKARARHLITTDYGRAADFVRATGISKARVSQVIGETEPFAEDAAIKWEEAAGLPSGWFNNNWPTPKEAKKNGWRVDAPYPDGMPSQPETTSIAGGTRGSGSPAPAPHEAPSLEGGEPDLVITQYDETGGSMGHGFNLTDNPPGHIRSWRVTHEWLRLNVPVHTGVKNLAIVTGFGPSMKPMFNPGDPLLVDTGVKVVDHEGVYFFRVGDEGFIKLIQRVPEFDGPGVRLRVISKNPDFPPYDLSPKNPHFEVLGKVLTVWRSEQF